MRTASLAVAALGCGGADPVDVGLHASTFELPPGTVLQHAAAENPQTGPVRWMLAEGSTWEIREGAEWESAAVVRVLEVGQDADLTVGGEVVLPATVAKGSTAGDARVTEVGPFEGWYGTYDPAASVEINAGQAAGTWVFAEGFGPVFYTIDGSAWDLVYYEERAL